MINIHFLYIGNDNPNMKSAMNCELSFEKRRRFFGFKSAENGKTRDGSPFAKQIETI